MKALVITDIQYDFLPGRPLGVPNGDEVIPVVNKLQHAFPLVVATQDWHPADHSSFASSHQDKEVYDKIMIHGIEQILWPDHCVQGTRGAQLSDDLSQNAIEAIFRKGMDREIDSYSAFFDNEHKKSTGLADYLKGRGVRQVYITGLAADFCVGFTVLDALREGFDTYLIEDASRAISQEGYKQIRDKIMRQGGKIVYSNELLN